MGWYGGVYHGVSLRPLCRIVQLFCRIVQLALRQENLCRDSLANQLVAILSLQG
jgi:hypothetical protein